MNLKQAQYILAVLEEGGVTAAAQRLYISQPALSQTIKSIETDIGAAIFVRGTNPIQLTYAGEKVVEAARRLTIIEQDLQNEISDINNEVSGVLRFGMPRGIWQSKGINNVFLPNVTTTFIKEYPQVNLKVIQTGSHDIEKMLLDGSLDLGLVRIPPDNPMLDYILLEEDALVIITGRDSDFAKRHLDMDKIDFSDIENETFIAKSPGNRSRVMLDYLFESYKIKPKIMFEFEEFSLATRITVMCDCIMFFSQNAFNGDKEFQSRTKAYMIKDHDLSCNSYICYHKEIHLTKFMHRWIDLIQSYQEINPD